MPQARPTYYEALGVTPDATPQDIARRYRILTTEFAKEASAPNPRREAMLREAYEALSDPQRREEYDRSLRGAQFLGTEGARKPVPKWLFAVLFLALAAAAAWYFMQRPPADLRRIGPGVSLQEIKAAALVAVGRVNRVDMSGTQAPLSTAVAVEEGVMLAPCQGIVPGAQLLVRIPPRDIPAQLKSSDDAIGLCRLAVSGGASWPLPMTGIAPRPGDTVYAVSLGPAGEVVVAPGEVKKLTSGPYGTIIESTARAGPPEEGSPLLDHDGRLVAIALKGEHTTLPRSWIVDAPAAARRTPPERPAEGETAPAAPPAGQEDDPRLKDLPPGKRERLEKAFRPPPNVPKDL